MIREGWFQAHKCLHAEAVRAGTAVIARECAFGVGEVY